MRKIALSAGRVSRLARVFFAGALAACTGAGTRANQPSGTVPIDPRVQSAWLSGQATSPTQRQVFFATDRNVLANGAFGVDRGPLNLGICSAGDGNAGRSEPIDASVFRQLRQLAAASPPEQRTAVLFVHGFNTDFNEACQRAAQLATQLRLRGPMFLFSWASRHSPLAYLPDKNNADGVSARHFASFLEGIAQTVAPERLEVVAHSMGSVVALEGLKNVATEAPGVQIDQLVLAAPDVDPQNFLSSEQYLTRMTRRVTVYFSSHDNALAVSRKIHGYPRLGASPATVAPWFDTVDASGVATRLELSLPGLVSAVGGHSYLFEPAVLADVGAVLTGELIDGPRRSTWLAFQGGRLGAFVTH